MYVRDFLPNYGEYWPIIYDYVMSVPPIFWILLGVAVIAMLLLGRRSMTNEDRERKIVADEFLNMLERLADEGIISWTAAEREILRHGRNYAWGDLRPGRMKEYQLTSKDIAELKGVIQARREGRDNTPINIPGDKPPVNNKKLLSGGRIGQLIHRRSKRVAM